MASRQRLDASAALYGSAIITRCLIPGANLCNCFRIMSVKLSNISSDYIAPSQSCVVSLGQGNKVSTHDDTELGEVHIHSKFYAPQPVAEEPKKVKITLHDCLACSGCVTSAESVLLEHQSIDELQEKLKEDGCIVIVSISPQSRSSLAAYYGLGPTDAFRRLTTVFRSIGAHMVLDTTCSRDLSLIETAADFVARYRAQEDRVRSGAEASTPSIPSSPTSTLPLLASTCPGWVVFAEKTHGDLALPLISTARSPQGAMGALVKRVLAPRRGWDPRKVYHCAVMPCYDRKLEAARDELKEPVSGAAEVDCVLATAEVQMLLERLGLDLRTVEPSAIPTDTLISVDPTSGALFGYPGSAGGYLEYVFRTAVRELFGQEVPPGPLPRTPGRNGDTWEVTWQSEGRTVLRFVAAYGFRNVKAVVRKLQLAQKGAGAAELPHFVEIMACPSGCVNGGGQVMPPPLTGLPHDPRRALDLLDATHHSPEIIVRDPRDSPVVRTLYDELGAGPLSAAARDLLHTTYRKRETAGPASVADW